MLLAPAAVLLARRPVSRPRRAAVDRAPAGSCTDTAFACPDQDAGRRVTRTRRARSRAGAGGGGRRPRRAVAVTQGRRPPTAVRSTCRRGALVDVPAPGGRPSAAGGAAAGLFGFRTDVGRGAPSRCRGCPAPRAPVVVHRRRRRARPQLRRWCSRTSTPGPRCSTSGCSAPTGRSRPSATTGITMAPHSRQAVAARRRSPRRPTSSRCGVHTARGRVVAAVDDGFSAKPSDAARATSGCAGTDLPSRTLRLAGLPARAAGSSTLLVANPSELEAVVEVRVAGTLRHLRPDRPRRDHGRARDGRAGRPRPGAARAGGRSRCGCGPRVPVVAVGAHDRRRATTPTPPR